MNPSRLASALMCFVCLSAIGITPAAPPVQSVRPDGAPNRAAWMAQGSFGVMTHYLISPQGDYVGRKDGRPEPDRGRV